MSLDYNKAKGVVTDNDKDRMLCVHLHTANGATNWEAATAAFGSTSVDSMKVSVRAINRKIEKSGWKFGGDTAAIPATPKSSAAKKRKAIFAHDQANEGEDEVPEAPAPKKRGRPKKVAASLTDKTDDGEHGGAGGSKTPAPKKHAADAEKAIKAEEDNE